MADYVRSAESGSDWSRNELMAYNITLVTVPPKEFFTTPDPSLDHIDNDILNSPSTFAIDPTISDVASEYLGYLDLAARSAKENFIDDFARETLRLLGFNERGITVSMRYIIPLTICGDANRFAQPDVCLLHYSIFVLLVLVQDKTFFNKIEADAEVVAQAIAAFQYNNTNREQLGLNRLNAMTIPAISMMGTRPTFFLVPVTLELSNAVVSGQYPAIQTRVLRCVTVLTHSAGLRTGMEDTAYRKLALKHFLAFKALAKTHWERILEGINSV